MLYSFAFPVLLESLSSLITLKKKAAMMQRATWQETGGHPPMSPCRGQRPLLQQLQTTDCPLNNHVNLEEDFSPVKLQMRP